MLSSMTSLTTVLLPLDLARAGAGPGMMPSMAVLGALDQGWWPRTVEIWGPSRVWESIRAWVTVTMLRAICRGCRARYWFLSQNPQGRLELHEHW